MFENKDYARLPLQELIAEQAKVYKQKGPLAVIAGLAFSILIYATIRETQGLVHYIFPVILAFFLFKNSQKLIIIRKELDARRSKENF